MALRDAPIGQVEKLRPREGKAMPGPTTDQQRNSGCSFLYAGVVSPSCFLLTCFQGVTEESFKSGKKHKE